MQISCFVLPTYFIAVLELVLFTGSAVNNDVIVVVVVVAVVVICFIIFCFFLYKGGTWLMQRCYVISLGTQVQRSPSLTHIMAEAPVQSLSAKWVVWGMKKI